MESADFVPLSALQHYVYCPRQCALIHLERIWADNSHTAEGLLLHQKAHSADAESRGELRTTTGLLLRSSRLGVFGQADVVEFRHMKGKWQPYPVEYKKGRPHAGCNADQVQLCAQAICLEEMLDVDLASGALFYGQRRRRTEVLFDPPLRRCTEQTAQAVHELFALGKTPPPATAEEKPQRCAACSLRGQCLPEAADRRAFLYLENIRLARGTE